MMPNELVRVSAANVPATGNAASLPVLVERAGGAARFAWDEFFYAEHHNRHTQRAYERAVRRFLGWCEGQGVELAAITPGMVGQYLVALSGSPSKRNQHLAALRGFFDRLVNRHVVMDAGSCHVGQDRSGRVEQDFPPLLVSFLGDVEVVPDAVGLQVADAGPSHSRDPAAGQEKQAHHRQVAEALQSFSRDDL
jgi:hypothetical protein